MIGKAKVSRNPHEGTKTPSNGIWIQDTDGYCHTAEEWTGKYTPNGIAVVTDNCSFVVALEDCGANIYWGGQGITITDIATGSPADTSNDYAGEHNTITIISQLEGTNDGYTDGAPAAEACRAFIFPNGKVGYMGAMGEWYAVNDNRNAFIEALEKCGGTAMSEYYWTSTQQSATRANYMNWDGNYYAAAYKYSTPYVRAFTSL